MLTSIVYALFSSQKLSSHKLVTISITQGADMKKVAFAVVSLSVLLATSLSFAGTGGLTTPGGNYTLPLDTLFQTMMF